MCICYFFVLIFVQVILRKKTLQQDQKEEGRSKDNVQGNLNPSFVFLFKEHFNFVVFRISLQGRFMSVFFPNV